VQQHQGEQSVRLRLVGHQRGQDLREADRLRCEVDAPGVALVEDQVDHRRHGGQPVRQQVLGRHA